VVLPSGLPRVYSIESDNGVEQFRFAPAPDGSYTGVSSILQSI
jgi:hypothetical protein